MSEGGDVPRTLVVVANRKAGGVDRLDDALPVLRAGAAVVELADPGDLAASLPCDGEVTVVAAGGDGTLHAVVQHLWSAGLLARTVVGLLPLGTGNDLARTLGIPLDPRSAAAVALSGHPRPLDLLVDDAGTVAVNAVHCGVGGVAVRHAAPLKPFLGRVAYRVGAAWAGARSPGWQLTVEVDDAVLFAGNVLFLGIGNGRTIGGGTVLWPQGHPDDGLADVVVVAAGGTRSRLEVVRALRTGDPRASPAVATGRGASVSVHGQPVPWVADGDDGGSAAARSWRVRAGAWRVRVSADDAAQEGAPDQA